MVKKVLSINHSDTSGKNGIQADLKTFQELGVFGFTNITSLQALTNTIHLIDEVTPNVIKEQLISVFSDGAMDGIKITSLNSLADAEVIVTFLEKYPAQAVVFEVPFYEANKEYTKLLVPFTSLILLTEDKIINELESAKAIAIDCYTQLKKDIIVPLSTKEKEYVLYNGKDFTLFSFPTSNLSAFLTAKLSLGHSLSSIITKKSVRK